MFTRCFQTRNASFKVKYSRRNKRSFNAGRIILRLLFLFLFSSFFLASSHAQWLEGYCYRKAISINASQVDGSGHTDFPVMIFIDDDNDLRSATNLGLVESDQGLDLRFTDNGGLTLLDFEIEDYNEVEGDLVAWVRIPSLSSSANTVIYLYFGNPAATAYPNPEGTWNSSYLGVWHTNTDANDATANGYDGNLWATTDAAGIAGRARGFNGGDSITLTDIDASEGTFSFWMNLDNTFDNTTAGSQSLISKDTYWANYFSIYLCGSDHSLASENGHLVFEIGNSLGFPKQISTTSSWTAGNWYMISGRWGINNHSLLVNGVVEDTESVTRSLENWGTIVLGKGYIIQSGSLAGSGFLDGIMDEVRLSNVNRSQAWLSTEYSNLINPLAFRSIGSLEANIPVADAGVDQDLCGVLNYSFFATPSIGTGSWSYVSGPDSNPFFANVNSPASSVTVNVYGTYVFRWTETNGSCTDSDEVLINFNELPVASAGANQELCDVRTTTLAADAYLYQGGSEHDGSTARWSYVSGPDLSPVFTDINSPMSDVTVTLHGSYVFRWTETNGPCMDSEEVTIVFHEKPIGLALPETQAVCSGMDITPIHFTNSNGNDAVTTYAWVRDNIANVPGLDISGSGDVFGIPFNPTAAPQTVNYTVTPTSFGFCAGDPFNAELIVNPVPEGFASTSTEIICSEESLPDIILMTYNGMDPATIFNWTRDNTVNVGGLPESGTGNIINGIAINHTGVSQTTNYLITPTSTEACEGISFNLSVEVLPQPMGMANPVSQTVCSNEPIMEILLSTMNGMDAGTTYEWTRDNTVNVTGLANTGTGDITGLPVNNTNVAQMVTYEIRPTSSEGCIGDIFTASFEVLPTPIGIASPASQNICSDEPIIDILLSTVNGMDALSSYTWTRDNTVDVTGLDNSGTGDITGIPLNNTNVDQLVSFTITPAASNGCQGAPFTAELLVYPRPVGTASPAAQTVCPDVMLTEIQLSTSNGMDGETTYAWTRDNTVNVGGLPTAGTGNISGMPINNTDVIQLLSYTITPTSARGCLGDPFVASVIVNPDPMGVATPAAQIVCSEEAISGIVLSTSNGLDAGTTYAWTRDNTDNIVGLENTGSGNIIGTGVNLTGLAQVVSYTITPTSGDLCVGDPFTATLIVNPRPIGTANPLSQTVCSDEAITDILLHTTNGMDANTSYAWTRDNTSHVAGLANSGTGSISGTAMNLTDIVQDLLYTIVPTSSEGCIGNPYTAAISVNPIPAIELSASDTLLCSGGSTTLSITNLNSALEGTWVYDLELTADPEITGAMASQTGLSTPTHTEILSNTDTVAHMASYHFVPRIIPGDGGADCVNGMDTTIVIWVNPVPEIRVSADTVLCSGETTSITVRNPNNPIHGSWVYDLEISADPEISGYSVNQTGISTPGFTETLSNNDTVVHMLAYRFIPRIIPIDGGADCANGRDTTIVIWVNPGPEIQVSADALICNEETAMINIRNPNIPIRGSWQYDLEVNPDPHILGSSTGQTGISASSITETLTNTDTVYHRVEYHFIPWISPDDLGSECINAKDTSIVIWVNPTPEIRVSADTVLCNQEAARISITNPNLAISGEWMYDLLVSPEPEISGALANATNLSLSSIADTLTNLGTEAHYVDYQFIPKIINGGSAVSCENGRDTSIRIWVNPTAHVNDPSNQILYDTESTTAVSLTTNNTGGVLSYAWFNDTPSIGLAASGAGDIPSFTATNSDLFPVVATITVIPSLTYFGRTCMGPGQQFSITVNPLVPVADAGTDQDLCGTLITDLIGNDPNIGSGTWTQVSGPGTITFSHVNSYSSSASASLYGNYVLRWTITSSGDPTDDDVVIAFMEDPLQAYAGADQELCGLLTTSLEGISHLYQEGSDHSVSTRQWGYVSGPDSNPVFSDLGSPTSDVTVNTPGTYVFRWTETNGTCTRFDELTISFYPNPLVDAGPDQEICYGESLSLSVTGGDIIVWDQGIVNDSPFTPMVTNEYHVLVTNEFGCSSGDTVVVVVHPIPDAPAITFASDTLHSDSESGNQWYVDDILIPDAEESFYIPFSSGIYHATVSENACESEKSNEIFVQITGVKLFEDKNLKIYPNPTLDFIQIETENIGRYMLEIRASNGQIMLQEIVTDPVYSVNLSRLINGSYFITIKNQDYTTTRKIIKL